MRNPFQPGDKKIFETIVEESDLATFRQQPAASGGGTVHPVYATFAIARDAEWACRLFVLDMKDDDEEGIGTMVTVEHVSPAVQGTKVRFEAVVESVKNNEIICRWTAYDQKRVLAKGLQGQKILQRKKLESVFKKHLSKKGKS